MAYKKIFNVIFISLIIWTLNFQVNAQEKSNGDEVLMQGFNWESWMLSGGWYNFVKTKAADLGESQIDAIWLPPPSKANAMAAQGYLPSELNDLNSAYGTETELIALTTELHNNGVKAIADIVINHRVGTNDWGDFTNPTWGCNAVVNNDEWTGACGGNDTGEGYAYARDLDHNNTDVKNGIKSWMLMLKNTAGFDGWRYDYVKGFAGSFIQEYNNHTSPWIVVGECWEPYNTVVNWLNSSGSETKAFDFGLKGALQSAFNDGNLSYLNAYGNMPSITGTHPSRSVTFLENHDTGYPQNHWPFPGDKVLQGYAYILTHPGTPMVFWNHYYEWGLHDQIKTMIQIRKANGIHSTSTLSIQSSQNNLYAAIIDNKVAMKIGSGNWSPSGTEWILAASGTDYAIWTKTSLEAPIVTINPAEGHYVDPITVTITATDNDDTTPTIYYTTDGSTPTTSSPLTGTSSVSFTLSESKTVKAIAVDDGNHTSSEISKTYTIGAIPCFKVHVKNSVGWAEVKIHYWDVNPTGVMLPEATDWPGLDMYPEGSNWYYYEFPNVLSTSLIFNSGTGSQTANLTASTDCWYDLGTMSWTTQPNLAPFLDFDPDACAFSEPVNVTITATDDSDPNPVFYYTTDGSTPTLTSTSATNYVTLNISENTTIKAFSKDISGNTSEIYSKTYQFVTGGFKIHFKKPQAWNKAKIYYWETLPAGIMPTVQWSGVEMISEGNGWYYYNLPGVTSTKFIFNDGDGNQSPDYITDKEVWYDNTTLLNAPTASAIDFTGTLAEGKLLEGSYTYSHVDNIDEALSTYSWYRAADASGTTTERILTAVDDYYTLNYNDVNKYIAFGVTPVDANGIAGEEVLSDFKGPITDAYTLTLMVSDGTNMIDGATVLIDNQTLTTAWGGKAEILLVNGNYPFTVNAAGFEEYQGTAIINNINKTIDVVLAEMAYEVTFTITNGSTPIQNAQINVNSEMLLTNSSGIVTMNLINGTYDYLVTKAGYNSATGSVLVSGSATNKNIVLTTGSPLYTLTYNVSDGANPVLGALIVVAGENLTTNTSGSVTVNLANGLYPYTLNAEGYDEISDTVIISNSNFTENIVLNTVYTVTFTVTSNGIPVQYAEISISGDVITTDVDGIATIDLPSEIYNYSISASGYEIYNNILTVLNEPLEVEVSLTLLPTSAQITFIVNDSELQTYTGFQLKGSWNPDGEYDAFWNYGHIHGLFFDDGTNGDVVADDNIWTKIFNLVPDGGENDWEWGVNDQDSVWIDGNFEFQVVDGSPQTLIFDLTGLTTYPVTFNVTDGTNPVQNAVIIVNGYSISSNSSGVAVVDLPNGTYTYTATKYGFIQASGEITVSGAAISEDVLLEVATEFWTVEFTITDGTNPIDGAKVNIAGTDIFSNTSGIATIELSDGYYLFTASADGYNNFSGNITVEGGNEQVDIELSEIIINIISQETEIKLYPNPTNGKFTIEGLTGNTNISKIILTDISGKNIELEVNKTIKENSVDISMFENGVYFIRIFTDKQIFIGKIIKK